ncbi:MAG: DUF4394 domain-containing protein [Acidobacteria bacterium]|nr:DUF4394 domain-containing protein [Acidobacteriota bacterium]
MKLPTLILAGHALAFSAFAGPLAFGVNGQGLLFRFDVDSPAVVTEIGNLGFVPVGIDFRPSTSTLYALGVGRATTQLYTVNIATGAATPVGAGFATSGMNYNLGGQTIGFDFNPTTLQADSSMRIRVVGSGGANLRLNSSTGYTARRRPTPGRSFR